MMWLSLIISHPFRECARCWPPGTSDGQPARELFRDARHDGRRVAGQVAHAIGLGQPGHARQTVCRGSPPLVLVSRHQGGGSKNSRGLRLPRQAPPPPACTVAWLAELLRSASTEKRVAEGGAQAVLGGVRRRPGRDR